MEITNAELYRSMSTSDVVVSVTPVKSETDYVIVKKLYNFKLEEGWKQ